MVCTRQTLKHQVQEQAEVSTVKAVRYKVGEWTLGQGSRLKTVTEVISNHWQTREIQGSSHRSSVIKDEYKVQDQRSQVTDIRLKDHLAMSLCRTCTKVCAHTVM